MNEQEPEQPQQNLEKPIEIKFCTTHGKDTWESHEGYIQNEDGSISCIYCPWGTPIAGYMRVFENKIVDLRNYKALAN